MEPVTKISKDDLEKFAEDLASTETGRVPKPIEKNENLAKLNEKRSIDLLD